MRRRVLRGKSIITRTLHFLVHNGFLFTVFVMCLVHANLLLLNWMAEVRPLVLLNTVSVIIYLFCLLLCKAGFIMPVYISILLEVAVYSSVAVYYIGWSSGSFYFLFSILPIIIYFGCFLLKGYKRCIIVLLLAMDFGLFVALYYRFYEVTPVYVLPGFMQRNMLFFSSFVMVFSIIFYNTLYIYSSEVERNSLEKLNVQLTDDANRDTLTQLLNRRGFLPKVNRLLGSDNNHQFCIAFCDIDNFKRINDSYGHDCGDEVLRNIARVISRELTDCSVCRWGGEEIVILMEGYDLDMAREEMENIREMIENTPTVFFNKRVNKTITVGIVENDGTFKEPEDIIRVADERMYYGKQHGKNIVIYNNAG